MSERIFGTVASWFPDRGFGFLRRDDGGSDVFVHVRALLGQPELEIGQRVEFFGHARI